MCLKDRQPGSSCSAQYTEIKTHSKILTCVSSQGGTVKRSGAGEGLEVDIGSVIQEQLRDLRIRMGICCGKTTFAFNSKFAACVGQCMWRILRTLRPTCAMKNWRHPKIQVSQVRVCTELQQQGNILFLKEQNENQFKETSSSTCFVRVLVVC